jgi:hypothetical protein
MNFNHLSILQMHLLIDASFDHLSRKMIERCIRLQNDSLTARRTVLRARRAVIGMVIGTQ